MPPGPAGRLFCSGKWSFSGCDAAGVSVSPLGNDRRRAARPPVSADSRREKTEGPELVRPPRRVDSLPVQTDAPPAVPMEVPLGRANPLRRRTSRTGCGCLLRSCFCCWALCWGSSLHCWLAPRYASRHAADFALSLSVAKSGNNLTVRWNPNAPAVRSAQRGVLEIDDGIRHQRLSIWIGPIWTAAAWSTAIFQDSPLSAGGSIWPRD